MTGSGGDSNLPSPPEDKQQKPSETVSYVYPVRSLLSGRFQHAGASDHSQKSPPNKDNNAGIAGPLATNAINLDNDEGDTTSPPIRGETISARRLSLDLGHGSSTVELQRNNSSRGELSSVSKSKKGTQISYSTMSCEYSTRSSSTLFQTLKRRPTHSSQFPPFPSRRIRPEQTEIFRLEPSRFIFIRLRHLF